MDELSEFILPACGLFWSVVGAWWIFVSCRRCSEGRALESTDTCKTKPAGRPQQTRFTGIFWLAVGIATLCFSTVRVGTAPAAASEPRVENGRLAEIVTQHVDRDFEERTRVGMVVGAVAKGKGLPLPDMDALIAATALQANLTLVTHNVTDFQSSPDLRIEDWLLA